MSTSNTRADLIKKIDILNINYPQSKIEYVNNISTEHLDMIYKLGVKKIMKKIDEQNKQRLLTVVNAYNILFPHDTIEINEKITGEELNTFYLNCVKRMKTKLSFIEFSLNIQKDRILTF
jgi:hypothetical protein